MWPDPASLVCMSRSQASHDYTEGPCLKNIQKRRRKRRRKKKKKKKGWLGKWFSQ